MASISSSVKILNKVKIKNLGNGSLMEYQLVPETEANLKEKKIAVGSPIAQGLIGKKVGDITEIQVPSGVVRFEVMEISI